MAHELKHKEMEDQQVRSPSIYDCPDLPTYGLSDTENYFRNSRTHSQPLCALSGIKKFKRGNKNKNKNKNQSFLVKIDTQFTTATTIIIYNNNNNKLAKPP